MKKLDINKNAIIIFAGILFVALIFAGMRNNRPEVNVNETLYTTNENSQYNEPVLTEDVKFAIEVIEHWANAAPAGWRYEIKQVNNNTIEYRLFTTKAYIFNMSESEWSSRVRTLQAATLDHRLPDGINVVAMFCEIGVPDVYYYKVINGTVVHDPVKGIVDNY